MSIQSELLLAASGVVDARLTEELIVNSDKLPFEIERRIRAWVAGYANTKWSPPKSHPSYKLREAWLTTPDELPGADLLDDELDQVMWVQSVNNARAALSARFPAPDSYGYGTDPEPPLSADQEQDWFGLVAVVDSPMRFVDEVTSGAVLAELRDAFEEVYPELLGLMVSVAEDEALKLAHPLPEHKEFPLNVLLGKPDVPPILPDKPSDEEKPNDKPPEPLKPDPEGLTTSQRLNQ